MIKEKNYWDLCSHICKCVNTCWYKCVCLCVFVSVCTYVCLYMCLYSVQAHEHTRTHRNTHTQEVVNKLYSLVFFFPFVNKKEKLKRAFTLIIHELYTQTLLLVEEHLKLWAIVIHLLCVIVRLKLYLWLRLLEH